MRPDRREVRPPGGSKTGRATENQQGGGSLTSIAAQRLTVADAEAWAEHLRGRFVVEVEVGQHGHTRTYFYTSARAAERCVERARARGAAARAALVQTLPVAVVDLDGGDR